MNVYQSLVVLAACCYSSTVNAFHSRTKWVNVFYRKCAELQAQDAFDAFEENKSYRFLPSGPQGGDDDGKKALIAPGGIGAKAFDFFAILERSPPSEMIVKFSKTAPANVQEAVKSTIVNLFGSVPNYALDAAVMTTSTKLANLLYQMHITGYMFKNAEYQMSMTAPLKGMPKLLANSGNLTSFADSSSVDSSAVRGQEVSVQTKEGPSVRVDVEELTNALSKEVLELREALATVRNEREAELRSNLLTYIQALPENEILRLTSGMSDDVVQAIQLMVKTVLEKIGVDGEEPTEKVIQQSMNQLAQLCMWQMVSGYKLRELEALETGISLPKEVDGGESWS